MKSWFDEWLEPSERFLSSQFSNYQTQAQAKSLPFHAPPPAKVFLVGGSSNSQLFQACVKNAMKQRPFFRNTKLVPLGDFDRLAIPAPEKKIMTSNYKQRNPSSLWGHPLRFKICHVDSEKPLLDRYRKKRATLCSKVWQCP